jgi:outer membrane murein-binding lipoprotein Lpp
MMWQEDDDGDLATFLEDCNDIRSLVDIDCHGPLVDIDCHGPLENFWFEETGKFYLTREQRHTIRKLFEHGANPHIEFLTRAAKNKYNKYKDGLTLSIQVIELLMKVIRGSHEGNTACAAELNGCFKETGSASQENIKTLEATLESLKNERKKTESALKTAEEEKARLEVTINEMKAKLNECCEEADRALKEKIKTLEAMVLSLTNERNNAVSALKTAEEEKEKRKGSTDTTATRTEFANKIHKRRRVPSNKKAGSRKKSSQKNPPAATVWVLSSTDSD